jgi:hypothetical protein
MCKRHSLGNGVTFQFCGLDTDKSMLAQGFAAIHCLFVGHANMEVTQRYGIIGSAFVRCTRCGASGLVDGLAPVSTPDQLVVPLDKLPRRGEHILGVLALIVMLEILGIGGFIGLLLTRLF